jgi:hypothetical protein
MSTELKEDLAALSDLTQKDKIQILLAEYAALRAELMARTGFGFQIAAVFLAGFTWFLQQQLSGRSWWFWAGMVGVGVCFLIAIFVNVRDLTRAARRLKDIEAEVNSRAGEHLLVWETLGGVVTRQNLWLSFVSPVKMEPRSALPPLDATYLRLEADRKKAGG